jgi:NAD(P)-dependent dehydrogenase (short-subunit alcohol dehydrogenase family)
MSENTENIVDQVYLVTGATDGIGLVTARKLAGTGARVVAVGRDPEKGEGVVSRIRAMTGNPEVAYLNADLSSQAEVRRLAAEFLARYDRLDVLINNAGGSFLRRQLSVDGLEMTFALNHLGYFLLTHLLLDTIKASAPARIINVSSGAHRNAEIKFNDLMLERGYGAMKAYGQSKLANILFTYELARRLAGTGVTTNAVHPGWVATNIGRNNGFLARLLMPLIQRNARSPEEGAATSIYLATALELTGVTGKYYIDMEAVPSSTASYDETAAKRLWEVSERLVGLVQ